MRKWLQWSGNILRKNLVADNNKKTTNRTGGSLACITLSLSKRSTCMVFFGNDDYPLKPNFVESGPAA